MKTESNKQNQATWVRYFNEPAVKIPNPYATATSGVKRVVPRVIVDMREK